MVWDTPHLEDRFGIALESFDVDGDGHLELLVGAESDGPTRAGAVYSIDDPLRVRTSP